MKLKNLFKSEKTNPKHLVGLEIIKRPWNKIALISSILVFAVTSLIPGPNIPGFFLSKLIMGKFG